MSPLLKNKLKSTQPKAVLSRYCLVSGLLAAVLMLFVYAVHNNTLVGGDNTVLRMDLYHQYGPLFSELYDRVVHGYSQVYSWTTGLGSSFTGNLLNYCSSPFALIILLTGHKNMPEAIALMILLKAVMSSVCFTYYINKSNGQNRVESIAFGLLYAFCGYFVAYSWNIMWLDAMAVFPLVILGIEKIILRNNPALYLFALTYTMVTNYYMAYMVCILSVLYFLYFYFGRYGLKDIIPVKKAGTHTEIETAVNVSDDNSAAVPAALSESESAISTELPETETALTADLSEAGDGDGFVSLCDTAVDSAEIETGYTEKVPGEVITQEPAPAGSAAVVAEKDPVDTSVKAKKTYAGLMHRRFWRTGITFAGASLVGFFISAVCLLPVAYCLSTSSATSGTFPTDIKYYFNIFDFIANHLPALETTIRSSGDVVLPNVYCGMLTVLLIPMYFLNSRIPGRKKICAAVILGVFYVSFSINYLNFIWHGFHMPNDLPFRYSFAYSFLLLTLAYQAFIHINDMTKKTVVGVGLAAMLFVVFVQELGSKNAGNVTINLSLILIVVYCIFLGMMLSKKARKDVLALIISIITMAELMVADSGKFVMQQGKANYVSDYDDYLEIKDIVEKDDDELFYRTELSKLRTRMDPSWYGYNGVSVFSSMAYEHVAKLMEKMGLFGNDINSFTYYPQTTLFNSIFDLKYIYDTQELINSDKTYKFIAGNDDFEAYKYNYQLGLGFGVDAGVEFWDNASANPFENQNAFVRSATGSTGDLYEKVDASEVVVSNLNSVSADTVNGGAAFWVDKISKSSSGNATVTINVEEDGNYYVYAGSTKLSSITVTAHDFSYTYVASAIQPFTLDVGYQPAGSVINVEYTVDAAYDSANLSFCAARMNDEKWQETFKALSSDVMELTSFNETEFTGKVNMTADGVLFTSVPYDESWNITVDGRKLSYVYEEDHPEKLGDIVRIGDALFGIRLSAGEHDITFDYDQRGFSEGLKLTFLGILIAAFVLVWELVIKKRGLFPKFRPLLLEEISE